MGQIQVPGADRQQGWLLLQSLSQNLMEQRRTLDWIVFVMRTLSRRHGCLVLNKKFPCLVACLMRCLAFLLCAVLNQWVSNHQKTRISSSLRKPQPWIYFYCQSIILILLTNGVLVPKTVWNMCVLSVATHRLRTTVLGGVHWLGMFTIYEGGSKGITHILHCYRFI